MNLEQSPFFYHGSAEPNPATHTQYGLYNPIANRFALVHHNPRLLVTVSKLFSSRYTLILCRLDTAKNFEPNLIDNTVCLNWTMSNASSSSFTSLIFFDQLPHNITQLTPADSLLENDLLLQDQAYLHYTLSWADDLSPDFDYGAMFKGDDLAQILDLPFEPATNLRAKLRKDVYNIIYKTTDLEQAQAKIQELKNNYDFSKLNLRIHKT